MNAKNPLGKSSSIPTVGWLIPITLLGAALRLFRLGAQSLWLDESLSLVFASVPLKTSRDSGSKVLHPRLFLHLWFGLPMIVTFLLYLRRPLYVDRLFVVTLPSYIFLLAWGTMGLKAPWSRWALGAGLVIAMTVGLSRIYFDARLYTKEDWRSAAGHVQSHSQLCDIIVLRDFQDLIPFNYYYQGEVQRVSITLNMVTTPLEELVEGHCRLWRVYRHAHESSHFLARSQPFDLDSQEANPQVRGWLTDHQGDILEEKGFSGVQVILYDLRPE